MNKSFKFFLEKPSLSSIEKETGEENELLKDISKESNIININPLKNFESKRKNGKRIFSPQHAKELKIISSLPVSEYHTGRWTDEEHTKFILGILEYGNEWKMVQKIIKSRTCTQARSHAQKFFLRLKNVLKDKNMSENPEYLLNYIFNSYQIKNEILNLNNGKKQRLLNIIISFLSKSDNYYLTLYKDNSNDKVYERSNEEDCPIEQIDSKLKKNIIFISNENNSIEENTFCNKKRKGSINKIFEIKKVFKYKNLFDSINNSNNFNKNNKKLTVKVNKKKIFELKKIDNSKSCFPFFEGNYINNNNFINNKENFNNESNFNNNINSNICADDFCNINSNNESTSLKTGIINDKEKFIQVFDSLNTIGENTLKKNYYTKDDYNPKNNVLEKKILFYDNIGFNEISENNFCYDEPVYRENFLFQE